MVPETLPETACPAAVGATASARTRTMKSERLAGGIRSPRPTGRGLTPGSDPRGQTPSGGGSEVGSPLSAGDYNWHSHLGNVLPQTVKSLAIAATDPII